MFPLSILALFSLFYLACCMPAADPSSSSLNERGWPCSLGGYPQRCNPHQQTVTTQQLQELQAQQPLDGLPSNSNAQLKYAALGIGHQNYTCNGTAFVQTEAADGASALLYDATPFLAQNQQEIPVLAEKCNFNGCEFPEILQNLLGDHYFSAVLQPTFNLTRAWPPAVLSGVKTASVNAPDPTVNVAWLFLTANPANLITHGLTEVYRFDTYGGQPAPTCSQNGEMAAIPYTAQYWFYD